jgi:hypothetical protein
MTSPIPAAPADHQVGDAVTYFGSLGWFDGVVAEVRHLTDEAGAELTAFVVHLKGVDGGQAAEQPAPVVPVTAPVVAPVVEPAQADEDQAYAADPGSQLP